MIYADVKAIVKRNEIKELWLYFVNLQEVQ